MSSNNVDEFLSLFLNYFVEIFSDLFYNGNLINTNKKFIKASYDYKPNQLVFRHFMYELLKTDDPNDNQARYHLILLLNFLDYHDAVSKATINTTLLRKNPKLSKLLLPMIFYQNQLHIFINNDHNNSFLGTFINTYYDLYGNHIKQFYDDPDNQYDLKFFKKYLKIPSVTTITTTSSSIIPQIPPIITTPSVSLTSPISSPISSTSFSIMPLSPSNTSSSSVQSSSTSSLIIPSPPSYTSSTIPSSTSSSILQPPMSSSTSQNNNSSSSIRRHRRSPTRSTYSSNSSVPSDPIDFDENFLKIENNILDLLKLNFTSETPVMKHSSVPIKLVFNANELFHEKYKNPLKIDKEVGNDNLKLGTLTNVSDNSNIPKHFFGTLPTTNETPQTTDVEEEQITSKVYTSFKPQGSSLDNNYTRKELLEVTVDSYDVLETVKKYLTGDINETLKFKKENVNEFLETLAPSTVWEEHINMEYSSFLTARQIHNLQLIVVQKMYDFLGKYTGSNKIIMSYKNSPEQQKQLANNVIKTFMEFYTSLYFSTATLKTPKVTQTDIKENIEPDEDEIVRFSIITSGAKSKNLLSDGSDMKQFLQFYTCELRNEYINEFLIPYLQSSCSPFCVFENLGSNDLTSDIDITILNTRAYLMKLMAQKITDVIFKPLFMTINNSLEITLSGSRTIKLSTNLSDLFDVNIYCTGWYNFCYSDITTYPYITPMDQCYKYDESLFNTYQYFFYSQINFAFIKNLKFFKKRLTDTNNFGSYLSFENLENLHKSYTYIKKHFVVSESLFRIIETIEQEKYRKTKFRYLQILILLTEQCLRKYQNAIAKITKKLNNMRGQKINLNNEEKEVNDVLIIMIQKAIEKFFLYEYLSLNSLQRCYEEESYYSIGAYFHVVIQLQKKQFYDQLFSPFIYVMSFLDNAGLLLSHKDKDKYVQRMLDAIIRFKLYFINGGNTIIPEDLQKKLSKDNNILNIDFFRGSKRRPEQVFKDHIEYERKLQNFAKSEETNVMRKKTLLVSQMYEIVFELMNYLEQQNFNYSPYFPDEDASTSNIKYHLPSDYNFFSNLSSFEEEHVDIEEEFEEE